MKTPVIHSIFAKLHLISQTQETLTSTEPQRGAVNDSSRSLEKSLDQHLQKKTEGPDHCRLVRLEAMCPVTCEC